MKNFPFEHNGQTLWYSRSVACSLYLFIYDNRSGEWYVLLTKRGSGCPSYVGRWNVPGGFLDFDETLEDCARRECFEETGVKYDGDLELVSVYSDMKTKSQNVVLSYVGKMTVDDIHDISTTMDHNEPNEVDSIQFWRAEHFVEYFHAVKLIMIPNQCNVIKDIYKNRILK